MTLASSQTNAQLEEHALHERRCLLLARGLHKSYRDPAGQRIDVIQDISLDVSTRKVIGIIGPSGSGKSTLLRLLAGLENPDAGTISFGDSPVDQPPPIPLVLQTPALLPWRTVRQNMSLGLELLHKNDTGAEVDRYIDLMGLSGFSDYLPRDLSGGMKARVSIGRALVAASELVLFDEAFTELDEITRQTLNDIFCERVERHGLAAVVVSHDISEAIYLADEILVLTKRPAAIAKTFTITLPRPRYPHIRSDTAFLDVVQPIRQFVAEIWRT